LSNEVIETAKATQEVAKTTAKAIAVSEKFGSFIAKYIAGSLEQGIGIFEDKLKYMRWERQVRLIDKADEIMSNRSLSEPAKAIPMKLAIPLFQSASLEEDDFLQDKWAYLLANSVDNNFSIEIKRNHLTALENMTKLEVQIFDTISKNEIDSELTGEKLAVNLAEYPIKLVLNGEKSEKHLSHELEASLNNLLRLGLLYNETFGAYPNWVRVSALGKELYYACNDIDK